MLSLVFNNTSSLQYGSACHENNAIAQGQLDTALSVLAHCAPARKFCSTAALHCPLRHDGL